MAYITDTRGKRHRIWLKLEKKLAFFRKLGLQVRKKQIEFFAANERFIVLIAGSRFGKSYISSMEVASEILLLPEITRLAQVWWIACPTEDLGVLEFDYIHDIICLAGYKPVQQVPSNRDREQGYVQRVMSPRPTIIITYPLSWGVKKNENSITEGKTIVQIRTGKRGHEHNFRGREVDGVVFSECAVFTNLKYIVEFMLGRAVTDRKGRFLMPTTPCGLGYLRDEIFEWGRPGKKRKSGWLSLGPYRSIDGNMHLEAWEYWKELLGEDSPAFQEQFLGLFTAMSGRVYPDFIDDETHVYNEREEQKLLARAHYSNYEILLGLDFGWTNPSAVIFAAKIGGRYFVFDEIYGSNILAEDLADMIREKLAFWGIYNYQAYADIDYQVTEILAQKGIITQPARKQDKFTRIAYVRSLFKVRADTGFPSIMFAWRCVHTRREHLQYHYKEIGRDDINPSELPEELDNHTCDALSYLIWTPQYHLYSKKFREKVR